jgi:hypothetical protein
VCVCVYVCVCMYVCVRTYVLLLKYALALSETTQIFPLYQLNMFVECVE